MKLGNYAHISVSVQSLRESISFYEKLGFRKLWDSQEPYPWILMTDGGVNLHLYELYFPSPALHYFSSHMQDKVLELMRLGIRPEQQKSRDGKRIQHNFFDPNELAIMLMHFDDRSMPKPNGYSESKLGVFGELSVDTHDLASSVKFWTNIGFTVTLRGEKPYPWAVLTDGEMTLGMHQTTAFKTPALTYYADDPASQVRTLREAGITNMQELHDEHGAIAGAIITAPDGQVFFLLEGKRNAL
jgi:catechol 2,3-dioxygenase-like lactoylglutathione lyase family enzyme